MIEIDTSQGSENEVRTAAYLRQLLDKYDVSRWSFTDRVVIDEDAIPHSHPVLTLSPFVPARSLHGLLSSFIHEQLHWYVDETTDPNAVAAINACRALFPYVPDEGNGGGSDEFSTYLHLVVNWLEIASMRQIVGIEDADALYAVVVEGRVYPWIYRQCIERSDDIAAVVAAYGFDAILR